MNVNEGLVLFIVERLAMKYELQTMTIGLLGMAFKADNDDIRSSLSYKMKKLLSGIDGDHLQLWAKLRKGDELHDMFEQLEETLRRLREARHHEIAEVEAAVAALRSAGAPDAPVASLEKISARFRRSIEMS